MFLKENCKKLFNGTERESPLLFLFFSFFAQGDFSKDNQQTNDIEKKKTIGKDGCGTQG